MRTRPSPPPAVRHALLRSALKREDGSFAPAYLLSDGRLERRGRNINCSAMQAAVSADSLPAALTRSAAIVLVGDELLAGKVRAPCISSRRPMVCLVKYYICLYAHHDINLYQAS